MTTKAAGSHRSANRWQTALILAGCLAASLFFISDFATAPDESAEPERVSAARQYLAKFNLLDGGRTAKMWVTQGTIVCGTMPDGTRFIVLGTDPEPKTGLAVEGVREYSDETEEQSKRVFNNLWSVTDC